MSPAILRVIPQTFLGVDIGTSAIKLVELSRWAESRNLKNYGEIKISTLYQKPFRTFEKNTLALSTQDIARAVRAILEEAKIETKKAVFSIPDFASFFTNFQLPPLTKAEVQGAVDFEARKYIPLPLSEVVFDWQIIEGRVDQKEPLKVLMVAVPREVINQYQDIAKQAGLSLVALEAEVFGLVRSSLKGDQRLVVLLDIGAQSTTVSVVHKGTLRVSHSLDIAGNSFTERIAQSLSLEKNAAEKEKMEKGMYFSPQNLEILSPLMDMIVSEINRISQAFAKESEKGVEKVILGGGTACLPGLKEYFEKSLQKEVEVADPFRSISFPPILEETIKRLGPSYAVAVGMALRGLQ